MEFNTVIIFSSSSIWFLFYVPVMNDREKPVKEHLKNVYGSLAISLLLAAAGSYINLIFNIGVVRINDID